MGVGKTTMGLLLAGRLDRPFRDTDEMVVAASGRAVADFFDAGEEGEFRRLEAQAVATAVAQGPVVIALGGGALIDGGSRSLLLREALLVHLQVPWERLGPELAALAGERPLLRGRSEAEVRSLHRRRLELYRVAPVQVTLTHADPQADLELLLAAVGPACL